MEFTMGTYLTGHIQRNMTSPAYFQLLIKPRWGVYMAALGKGYLQ